MTMEEMNGVCTELQRMVDESQHIVFFGGAGVSTESGIPDFRSVDGLYHIKYRWSPEQMLSHTFFVREPEEFFRFYREKLLPTNIKPNKAHLKLAEMEKAGKLSAVVTQNIDGLHQDAGSQCVYELHGSTRRNYCMKCGKFYDQDAIRDSVTLVPVCTCGGRIKPDVVLYEEGLDNDVVAGAVHAIRNADMMIVAGTSLSVYPAAGLLNYFRGRYLVLINRDETPLDDECNLVIHDKVGEVLGRLRV